MESKVLVIEDTNPSSTEDHKKNRYRYLAILLSVWAAVKEGRACDDIYLHNFLFMIQDLGLTLDYKFTLVKNHIYSEEVSKDVKLLRELKLLEFNQEDKKSSVMRWSEMSEQYVSGYKTTSKGLLNTISVLSKLWVGFPLSKINRLSRSKYIEYIRFEATS